MIRRAAAELRSRTPPGGAPQAALLAAVLLTALAWLPAALRADIRGARANLRLTAAGAGDARGPSATAGTNLSLVHAAQRRIPRNASFAIVPAGRWGSATRPNRALAFVWQAGQSWTQFELAPRTQVDPGDAAWLLVRGAGAGGAGIRHAMHAWRFGADWLVEVRR
jgi:hypothetical protein